VGVEELLPEPLEPGADVEMLVVSTVCVYSPPSEFVPVTMLVCTTVVTTGAAELDVGEERGTVLVTVVPPESGVVAGVVDSPVGGLEAGSVPGGVVGFVGGVVDEVGTVLDEEGEDEEDDDELDEDDELLDEVLVPADGGADD